jgi:altronate hydrolase
VDRRGFVYMDTPGYDPVSATGQVAGGANVLCFTTGRGSAFGCKPTPSIKLATDSEIYRHVIDDINCGDIVEGVPIDAKGREIFDSVLRSLTVFNGPGENELPPVTAKSALSDSLDSKLQGVM